MTERTGMTDRVGSAQALMIRAARAAWCLPVSGSTFSSETKLRGWRAARKIALAFTTQPRTSRPGRSTRPARASPVVLGNLTRSATRRRVTRTAVSASRSASSFEDRQLLAHHQQITSASVCPSSHGPWNRCPVSGKPEQSQLMAQLLARHGKQFGRLAR